MIGAGIIHFVTICGTLAAFLVALVSAALYVFNFLVEHVSLDLLSGVDNSLLDFVSYTFNFPFIYRFMATYYFIFCSIAISFILLSIAEFCAHVYPIVVQFLRSQLNFISGDS